MTASHAFVPNRSRLRSQAYLATTGPKLTLIVLPIAAVRLLKAALRPLTQHFGSSKVNSADFLAFRGFPMKGCLTGKADFTGRDIAYQTTGVHSTVYGMWRAGDFVNIAVDPASGFHRFQ